MQSTLGRSGNDVNPASSGFLHPLLARFQQLNSQSPPAAQPSLSAAAPMPQQASNPSAPIIRAQVQALVPDGQGGTQVLRNEEALRAMFSLPTPSSTPQHPQENGTEGDLSCVL
jgi:hypothetical protein